MNIPFVTFKPMEKELDKELRGAFERVYDASWYIKGKEDEKFEHEFAEYCGVKYCVGVGNGLDLQVSCVEQKQCVLNALAVYIIRQSLSCFFFKECGKITGILV